MSPRRPHRRARRRSSRPTSPPARRGSGRRRPRHRRTHPGLAPVRPLRLRFQPHPGRSRLGRGRPVQRHRAEVRTLVDDLPSQSRQVLQEHLDSAVRQTSDESSKADLATAGDVAAVARWPVRRGLRRTGPSDGRIARRSRRVPRAAPVSVRRQPRGAGDHRHVVVAHRCRPRRRATGSLPPARCSAKPTPATAPCDDRSPRQRGTAGFPLRSGSAIPRIGRWGRWRRRLISWPRPARWPSPTISSCEQCG